MDFLFYVMFILLFKSSVSFKLPPKPAEITRDHLVSLQEFLGSNDFEETMQYSKLKNGGGSKFDYTTIIEFFFLEFIADRFQNYTSDQPVFVFELDLHFKQLGNRLGNYFEVLSFARKHGLHFVAFGLHSHTQILSQQGEHFLPINHAFVKGLSTVFLHPNPTKDRSAIVKMLSTESGKTNLRPWPWQQRFANWLGDIEFIGRCMRQAVSTYIFEAYGSQPFQEITLPASTFHQIRPHSKSQGENGTFGAKLPLIPDVAILFRCVDIVLHGGNEYGFLSFNTYPAIIPKDSRNIYILSEPLKYGPWTEACINITHSLMDFLTPLYPNATILVRRGYVFDSLAIFSLSKNVICTPSTFCFYPSLANSLQPYSNVNFAVSPLISDGLAPNLTANFHWITQPKIIGFWRQSKYDLRWPNASDYIVSKLKAKKLPDDESLWGGYNVY